MYVYNNILPSSSYKEKCSRQNCRENQNTCFTFSDFFFSLKNRAVYEITWKNMVEPDRRIACWVTKVIDTYTEYIILTVFPHRQWLGECVLMLCALPVLLPTAFTQTQDKCSPPPPRIVAFEYVRSS